MDAVKWNVAYSLPRKTSERWDSNEDALFVASTVQMVSGSTGEVCGVSIRADAGFQFCIVREKSCRS